MIRLVISIVLLLASLLVLFKAPTHFLWLMAVATTSYPLIGILLSTISFVAGYWASQYKLLVLCFSMASLIIFSLPIIMACNMNKKLVQDMNRVFPVANTCPSSAFSLSRLFTGIGTKTIQSQPLVYKKLSEKELSLDFYPSVTKTNSPIVVVVHGGSWESGNSKQLPELNSYLANKGYHVAAINYRLAPAYQSPAPIEDVKDAVAYLKTNASTLQIDTSNIILLGRSAGVQIALCAAYAMKPGEVKAAIDFYGPADMIWGGQQKTNSLVLDVNSVYNHYFGGNYEQVPNKFKEASAVDYVNEHSVPTLIIHGKNDAMVSVIHSEHLAEKLKQNKVPHYFLQLPLATHGCDYNLNGPDGQLCTYAVEHFLNSVTQQAWKN